MRILIVEDDPVLADGLTRSLRQADFAVDCVHDGDAADHILTAQAYDLVILDLGLPKLDGFDVLKRLRRRGSGVPVLVLTARDALSDKLAKNPPPRGPAGRQMPPGGRPPGFRPPPKGDLEQ